MNPNLISGLFNQLVDTPLGQGIAKGIFQLKNAHQEGIGERMLVRLPVNDVTRPHLKDENCLTPKAEKSALFTFPIPELEV